MLLRSIYGQYSILSLLYELLDLLMPLTIGYGKASTIMVSCTKMSSVAGLWTLPRQRNNASRSQKIQPPHPHATQPPLNKLMYIVTLHQIPI